MEIAEISKLDDMDVIDSSNWPCIAPRDGILWGDMKHWIRENMKSDYYWQPEGIRIKNDADAVLFKLKFG